MKTLDDEYRLSFYKEIGVLDEEGRTVLVQHTQSKKVYILKRRKHYNIEVFRELQRNPVKNTPKIIELAEGKDGLSVIEEYISGETLAEKLSQKGCLSEEETTEIILQLCDIVRDLHRHRPAILHRDIKPENIILTYEGRVRLLDFDAAKLFHGEKSRDTVLLGTVGYASPEQYGFAPSSIQSDIYSIGVLINELLTGKMPQECHAEGRLWKVIEKSIQIDPKNRYSSVEELKAALTYSRCSANTHGCSWFRLLPGFRSQNGVARWVAAFAYLFILLMGLTMETETGSTGELWLNRVFFLLIFYSEILFCGNFLNIQGRLGIAKIRNVLGRIAVIIVGGVLILSAEMVILLTILSEMTGGTIA